MVKQEQIDLILQKWDNSRLLPRKRKKAVRKSLSKAMKALEGKGGEYA